MRFTAGLFVLTVLNAIVGETESAREAMRVVGQPPRLFVVRAPPRAAKESLWLRVKKLQN